MNVRWSRLIRQPRFPDVENKNMDKEVAAKARKPKMSGIGFDESYGSANGDDWRSGG
jgi:hypothetical protein